MREMERKSAAHKIVNGPTVKTTTFDEMKQLTLFEVG
jgi:hypothetical protein